MLNWLTGRSKSNLPEPTALQTQRTRQIEQLKSFNQNVSEIQRDVEYRVNSIVNGATLSLYITLPPQFPQEKPMVKVTPRLSHKWINDQMIIIGSPGINGFMVHSDLGKVIREVVEEFQRNPPSPLPQQYYPYSASPSVANNTNPSVSMPQPYSLPQTTSTVYRPSAQTYSVPGTVPQASTVSSTAGYPPSTMNGPPNYGIPDLSNHILGQSQAPIQSGTVGGYRMPEMPSSISQLRDLSSQELKEMIENEDNLIHVIESLPEIQQVALDRERYTEENERLARQNLSLKPFLEDKKKILLEKFDIFNDIKQKYDENSHRQDILRQNYDPRHIQDRLKAAAQEAEEISEGIADSFLDGKITVDEFKKNFMDKRKVGHLRRAKEERLTQCIISQMRGGF